MSEQTARTVRRELRRTVGEDALRALEACTLAINHQILPNLNALHARLRVLEQRLDALTEVASIHP